MTHNRVLPRDLFNEANLLKCVGKIVMAIEDGEIPWLQYHYDGDVFNVIENPSDGSLFIGNIQFFAHRRTLQYFRPLNSREPWLLWLTFEKAEDDFEIFDNSGSLILKESDFKKEE